MVMDGGSVVAQQPATPTPAMTATSQQQQQAGQVQAQGQGVQAGGGAQESAPNATRVAREFVRQYYTILHESPVHLHRFYNDESDFIHGGLDSSCGPGAATGVRGQQEIHRTILALNFHDCYAKIAYVDAQESTNKSVVVQVAGELSNRGSPMRRFLQTFVLVPLSARKYYVRNDIFRYQDEIYTEDTADEDDLNANEATSSSTSANQHHLGTALANGGGDHGHHGHRSPMNGTPETSVSSVSAPSSDKVYHSQSSPEQVQRKDDSREDSLTTTNNNNNNNQWDGQQGHQQMAPTKQQPTAQPATTTGQSSQSSVAAAATGNPPESAAGVGAAAAAAAATTTSSSSVMMLVPDGTLPTATPAAVPPPAAPVASTAQRSWSQMVQVKPAADPAPVITGQHQQPAFGPPGSSSTTGSSNQQNNTFGGSSPQSGVVSGGGMPQRTQHHNRQQGPGGGSAGQRTNGMTGGAALKKEVGVSSVREEGTQPTQPLSATALTAGGGTDPKNIYNVPDNQQLFVGNIPTTATEQDLQDLFKQFGNVIGFRLQNSKNNTSGGLPGGKTSLPNFGFVLFDSPEPVRKLLSETNKTQSFTLPGKAPVMLNIEQKKPRAGGKGSRGPGGPSVVGRPPMTNGGGSGGRREYSTGGDRRPPRGGMGNRGQGGRHDGPVGPTQH